LFEKILLDSAMRQDSDLRLSNETTAKEVMTSSLECSYKFCCRCRYAGGFLS